MRAMLQTPILMRGGRLVEQGVAVVLLCLTLIMVALWPQGVRAEDFLPADQAFRPSVGVAGKQAVRVDIAQVPGVYLYRERFEARLQAGERAAPEALSWRLPPGESKHDATFDKVMEVYHGPVSGEVALPAGLRGEPMLTIVYQGCADAGLCYPPQTRRYELQIGPDGALQGVRPAGGSVALAAPGGGRLLGSATVPAVPSPAAAPAPVDADGDRVSQALASGRLAVVLPVFLLAGLLLSLTPCVLPMVPILSSIIVGQQGRVSRGRGFALALSYSQGMALVYTGLGVAAGLLGQGLAAYLQHPWVVLGFGALMVLLALSMFGLYELRLPVAVQSWLGEGTQHLPGGRFLSVFAMGVVSALIVSPCVSAPLAGALLYISQTRDVWLGGGALYAMAWGMSVPLLLVGLSAGTLLPRTGPWMKAVKALFGVLMLVMAAWVTRPAWPVLVAQVTGQQAAVGAHRSVLPFERVRNVAELDAALARAAAEGRPVMLDFYADWCVSCVEMEQLTFRDEGVRQRVQRAVLLQADVTANNDDDRALLARFQLFGPPGILFWNAQGQPVPQARVVGFQKPEVFVQALQQAGL
ncbi:protein-disulfide reductase DsbD [Aquabacterium olei]|uniref:Protein-disulfide reductase DsbD n=2 Tax=Aquabacterium olei TaxID=1296669 RepID=A0A2U8FMU3_9BURK|nr:protein-disulfide reductase DsbD [Aquabacterium olei]